MNSAIPSFDEYVASLGAPSTHADPTIESAEGVGIKTAATELAQLKEVSLDSLTEWVTGRRNGAMVLGLVAGLSHEKLTNMLRHGMGTAGFVTLAKERPAELIDYMDKEFGIVRLLEAQRHRNYDFGDVLVARAGTKAFAVGAGRSGRNLEDEIEDVVNSLGILYQLRTRFEGRNSQTGPCDLAIPAGNAEAEIVVAAKYFGSTGSKQSAAVDEIAGMANVRKPTQFVFAVVDGIGWKGRIADLKRLYDLWHAGDIDGMYTRATLGTFQEDLIEAATRRGLNVAGKGI